MPSGRAEEVTQPADERSGDLLARWRTGDQQAADQLFRRYTSRLVALARSRLPARLGPRVDAEDVVQSVYRSFFAGAGAGRYDVQRGGDLWRLLVTITLHKLYLQVKRNSRQKRDVRREQALGHDDELLQILAKHPAPAEALALVDELEQSMSALKPLARRIVELRLQGWAIAEIAADTRRSERRVHYVIEEVKQQLEQRHCKNGQ